MGWELVHSLLVFFHNDCIVCVLSSGLPGFEYKRPPPCVFLDYAFSCLSLKAVHPQSKEPEEEVCESPARSQGHWAWSVVLKREACTLTVIFLASVDHFSVRRRQLHALGMEGLSRAEPRARSVFTCQLLSPSQLPFFPVSSLLRRAGNWNGFQTLLNFSFLSCRHLSTRLTT